MPTAITTIRAGDLSERVALQSLVRTELGGGAATTAWTDGPTVAARVRPLRGREQLHARQIVGGTTYEVVMRWPLPGSSTLKGADRLKWFADGGNRTLHLSNPPALDPSKRWVVFHADQREGA